jgi:hypothetical protein
VVPRTTATRRVWLLLAVLLSTRLPSLAQPAGPDQGLYSYVGWQILRGAVPYRDAWDQKPPAIHYTYSVMRAIWPHDSVVAAADWIAAGCVAVLLVAIGRGITGRSGPGELAAGMFLILGNPAVARLGGIRVRAQCETFIALTVTAAVWAVCRATSREGISRTDRLLWCFVAGVLLGLTFLYKYNAVFYGLVPCLALLAWSIDRRAVIAQIAILFAGAAVPVLMTVLLFATTHAWDDLWQATVVYNLRYSGETYGGIAAFIRYLVTFPTAHARVDPLWLVGGLGCAALLIPFAFGRGQRRWIVIPIWVAVACLAIAANGSRNLPQYFVQAAPALALAGGVAGFSAWHAMPPWARATVLLLLVIAVGRVGSFAKGMDYTLHDLRYLSGRLSRADYLSRFGGREQDKFSALDVAQLSEYLGAHTTPDASVLVFGFSPGVYVQAERRSASRFFWSRPLIVNFNADKPGYGPAALLVELQANRPQAVVLQHRDWQVEGTDSASYFMSQPALAAWLRAEYQMDRELGVYQIWLRRNTPTETLEP